MKTPPDRSGITFEVGAQLEARDRHKNWSESVKTTWMQVKHLCLNVFVVTNTSCLVLSPARYQATIEKVDRDKEQVLIHYRQWSRRHNEWFHWNSPYLRPLERVSLRRQGLNPQQSQPVPRVVSVLLIHTGRVVFSVSCSRTVVMLVAQGRLLSSSFFLVSHCRGAVQLLLVFIFSLFPVSDVCFRLKGSGLLDRLSFLPSQGPQSQQGW